MPREINRPDPDHPVRFTVKLTTGERVHYWARTQIHAENAVAETIGPVALARPVVA